MNLRTVIQASLIAFAVFAPAWAGNSLSLTAVASALRSGRAADAETMATQLLADRSAVPLEHAYLLLDRGLAREQLHRRREAVSDFTVAIDSKTLPHAELARAVFDRGVILDELGRTEDAIADYSRAILLVPHYAAALNNRGNAYRRMGRHVEARTDYNAALAANDDEPEYPLYGLGRIAEAEGNSVTAKNYYERALAANGLFASASKRLAQLRVPDDSYALRAPVAAQPISDGTGADESAGKPAAPRGDADGASATGPALRPAILDSSVRAEPVTLASLVSAERIEASGMGDLVQLGAWRSQGNAAVGWNRLTAVAHDLLKGAVPHIAEADVPGKGRFWRLRTRAPFGKSADQFCAELRAKHLACIAVHS